MAATQQLIETLQEEVAVLKKQFDKFEPKFTKYDLMELENGPWKENSKNNSKLKMQT